MISRNAFRRYLEYVRRSDVHTLLEAQLRPEPGGRPRPLKVDVLLAGMLATFSDRQTLAMTQVHKTLTTELANNVQRELGIRDQAGNPVTLRQVRYLLNAVTNLFEHTEARRPELDQPGREAKQANLQELVDQLLASATTHIGTTNRYAIDGTAIESAARGKRRPRAKNEADTEDSNDKLGRSYDVDARWGYRTRTYDNKSNLMFGYQMMAFTRVSAVGGKPEPLLTERIAVVPGNQHGIAQTIATLDRLSTCGAGATEIISDRGFSYSAVEDWADQLRHRGIEQVLDMHQNDHGARVHEKHGYVMINGWAHCPSIPDELIHIRRPAQMSVGVPKKSATPDEIADHKRRQAEVDKFNDLIAQRRVYRFERHGVAKSGAERYKCPARAGKVVCDGCPLSKLIPAEAQRPTVEPPPGAALPKACSQETIVVRESVEPKLRQREYWGSPEWQASFNRRVRVEGAFGVLKSPKGGNVRRGWTHQVGLVKTTLLLAIAVAATNLQQLTSWARSNGDTRDPLTTVDLASPGFIELEPDGGNSPPTPAD
jgi:hypothetical protein